MELSKRPNRKGGFVWVIRWWEGKRQRQKTLKGIKSEEAARMALAEELRRIERAAVNLPTDPLYTVGEALDNYLDARRGLVTEAWRKIAQAWAARIKAVLGADLPLARLDDDAVGRLRAHLVGVLKLAAPTVNRHMDLLKAAARKAGKGRAAKIDASGLPDLDHVSDNRDPAAKALSDDQIGRLLAALRDGGEKIVKRRGVRGNYRKRIQPDRGLYELVVMMLNTAGRPGELLALRWRDWDPATGQLRLVATKNAAKGRQARERWIPANDALRDLLKTIVEREKPGREDRIVSMSRANIQRKWRAAVELADIGHARLYDLRHSALSHMAASGTPLHVLMRIAGHKNLSTAQKYLHMQPGEAVAATAALNFGAPARPKAQIQEMAG